MELNRLAASVKKNSDNFFIYGFRLGGNSENE